MAEAPKSYKDPYWQNLSAQAEQKVGLPAGLLNNIVMHGERSNADQVSEAGARTPFQIIPSTRKLIMDKYGVDPYLSPENAAESAALLLKESLERNKGDVSSAVAEYHGGTNRANWGPRTRAYVGRVMSAQQAQQIPQEQPSAQGEQQPQQSTFQRALAEQQSVNDNAIAQVYDAYQSGQLSPEESAQFEEDVRSGLVMLPRGATLAGETARAPTEAPQPEMLPPEVTEAYQTGQLNDEERAQLEQDIRDGIVQLAPPRNALPDFQDGVLVPEQPGIIERPPEPTVGEQIIGAGETALALGTGATGGAIGAIGGTLKGLAEQILSGQFGTQDAADLVEQRAMQGAEAFTYAPRTEAGRAQTQAVGEAIAPLAAATPFTQELGAITQGIRAAAPAARVAAQPVATAAQRAVQPVARAVERARQPSGPTAFGAATAGAAATPEAIRRVETASQLPVPFKGKAGLTSGQASRDFAQLQFEKETAKASDIGAPLRERVENQTATMIQNFDALVDRLEPIATSRRELGEAVDRALVNRAESRRKAISAAYDRARKAGEMENPVELTALSTAMKDLERYEGLGKNVPVIRREALRIGALVEDADGNLKPGVVSIDESEDLRQFVNRSTDWMDGRESMYARVINGAIDEATEGNGGELYRKARKLRADYANEFENVGLTSKLLNSKRGTDDRQIALEDVFDKIIVSSKVDDMNKLRATLLKAGPEGRQAWNDLKAAGIERIKTAALSASQMDSQGNPLLSPDKLNRVINNMDETGKLEALYGKKQAQIIRDLGDLANVIYTAPPGAINTSNTASALMVALDSLGTFAVTGVPAPVATALKEASQYLKNQKIKARISEALKGVGGNE